MMKLLFVRMFAWWITITLEALRIAAVPLVPQVTRALSARRSNGSAVKGLAPQQITVVVLRKSDEN